MKKIFYFAAFVVLVSMSSCTTECTCTMSATGAGSEYFQTVTTTFTAKSDCSEGNSTTTSGDLTISTVCK